MPDIGVMVVEQFVAGILYPIPRGEGYIVVVRAYDRGFISTIVKHVIDGGFTRPTGVS